MGFDMQVQATRQDGAARKPEFWQVVTTSQRRVSFKSIEHKLEVLGLAIMASSNKAGRDLSVRTIVAFATLLNAAISLHSLKARSSRSFSPAAARWFQQDGLHLARLG